MPATEKCRQCHSRTTSGLTDQNGNPLCEACYTSPTTAETPAEPEPALETDE